MELDDHGEFDRTLDEVQNLVFTGTFKDYMNYIIYYMNMNSREKLYVQYYFN
jgi:hypothetical protein